MRRGIDCRHGEKLLRTAAGDVSGGCEGNTVGEVPKLISGRYRVERVLRTDASFQTLFARDLEADRSVVLKRVDRRLVSPSVRLRLAFEVNALAASALEARPLAFGEEGESLFTVRAFVEGASLETKLVQGSLSVSEAADIFIRVLDTLDQAHRHGVLHRNIRPSNIILEAQGATLVGFGLGLFGGQDPSPLAVQADAAFYLSPEQLGLLAQDVGPASDLYAVGAVLYECLAGRAPFFADSVSEVLRQHLSAETGLRARGANVPTVIDDLVRRLLRTDPRERYQSARSARDDLHEVVRALARGEAEPQVIVGAHDIRVDLTEPGFVGRAAELAAANEHFDGLARGQGGILIVEGVAGVGKTRFIEELAVRAAAQRSMVLRGKGVRGEARRPFQLLQPTFDFIVDELQRSPEEVLRLRERLAPHLDALFEVVPQLARLLGAELRTMPEAFGESRVRAALLALLEAIGTQTRPALFILDDSQWADALTQRLFDEWQAPRPSPRWTSLILVLNTDETPSDHVLRKPSTRARIQLLPFDDQAVRAVAESMAGPLPAEVAAALARLSKGNPFWIRATLQGYVESGVIVHSPEGWRIGQGALEALAAPEQAARLLADRLLLVADPLRNVLVAGAVLGKTFTLEAVCALVDQSTEVLPLLDEARARHFVWADAQGAAFTFTHQKLRDFLLQRLSPERVRDLHATAARFFAATNPPLIFDAAYHFDAADRSALARDFALQAAELARARSDLELAERNYRIALKGNENGVSRFKIAEALGEVLTLRGSYDEAEKTYALAAELASDRLDEARLASKVGDLFFKRGDVKAAGNALERALALLGRPVPQRKLSFLFALLVQAGAQVLHTYFPKRFLAKRLPENAAADLLAMRIYGVLMPTWFFYRPPYCFLWAHLRHVNLAELYPPSLELGQAYALHGVAMVMGGKAARGVRYAERGLAIRRAEKNLWGEAHSLSLYAMVLYNSGRLREARERCQQALQLLERTGDRWEASNAATHDAAAAIRLGNIDEGLRLTRAIYDEAIRVGAAAPSGYSMWLWAWATGGQVPAELLTRELERPSTDVQSRVEVEFAQALVFLAKEDPQQAVTTLQKARDDIRRAGLQTPYVQVVHGLLATASRVAAAALPPWSRMQRASLLAQAERAANDAVKNGRRFPNDLPSALREKGLLAAIRGDAKRARKFLDQSLALAESQQQRFESAQTLWAQAQVGEALGWPGARDLGTKARAQIEAMGLNLVLGRPFMRTQAAPSTEATVSLADRFVAILESGRAIATALSNEAIFSALRTAALRLLRGDQCLTFARGAEGLEPVGPEDNRPFDHALVQRGMVESGPVARVSTAIASGPASALCAPIRLHGETAACFYVAHASLTALYGDEELRLAAFLATLAGAALENAAGFARVNALSRSLEAQVLERTSDLVRTNEELRQSLEQLRQAQTQLVEAGRAAVTTSIIGGLSHEMNNPLAAVLTWSQTLLRYATLDEPTRTAVTSVARNAQRCARILAALRVFTDHEPTPREPQSVATLLTRVAELVEEEARERNVRTILSGEGLPPVRIAGEEMAAALANLVRNAVEASPPAGTVSVVAHRVDGGVEIAVHDEGAGIPTQIVDRAADPFFTTKGVGPMGLGLSIARRIIDGQGGRLTLESEPGKGTTVKVWLPVEPNEESPPPSETQSPRPSDSHRR